jgi:DNA polymerase-3 subunit beta
MKLTVNRSGLLAALAAVKPVAGRGTLPILSNLLLVGKGNDLNLTATDLDVHLRVKIEAAVSKEGKTTVRAGLLFDTRPGCGGGRLVRRAQRAPAQVRRRRQAQET